MGLTPGSVSACLGLHLLRIEMGKYSGASQPARGVATLAGCGFPWLSPHLLKAFRQRHWGAFAQKHELCPRDSLHSPTSGCLLWGYLASLAWQKLSKVTGRGSWLSLLDRVWRQ